MVVYRKMLDHWYIFVLWDYLAHLRVEDQETYNINLLRFMVDQPYGEHMRDKQGSYVPGSLVGAIYPPQGILWLYTSVEQLDAQISQALLAIAERIPWLEDPESTMGYTG